MRSFNLLLTVVCALSFAAKVAFGWTPPQPIPLLPVQAEPIDRRDAIHRELDGNHEAVKHLYDLLDGTPKEEVAERSFIEGQIRQFDQRSGILFKELDVLDKLDFQATRKEELELQASRLEDEASQLRKSKLVLPAAVREAAAKSLRKALADGSWKQLVADEWSCDTKDTNLATTIQLAVEVEKLKTEAVAMRRELKQLRTLVEKIVELQVTPELAPKKPE